MCTFRHPKVCKYYRDYRKCKFDPCMFSHVEEENDPEIEKLKQENELIQKQIENLEKTMNDLNTKILEKEDFIDKLVQVEKKFERVITIEKDFCDKSSAIETLISKVDALEDELCEKDNIIKDLTEKVNSLLENENIETVADELEVSENEKTFCNPSEVLKNCPHCKFETKSTDDIAKHIRTKHEIRCPHCSFVTY